MVEKSWPSDVRKLAETTIEFMNNQIKYGRNKWAFQISTLKTSDSNQLMRAGSNQTLIQFEILNYSSENDLF